MPTQGREPHLHLRFARGEERKGGGQRGGCRLLFKVVTTNRRGKITTLKSVMILFSPFYFCLRNDLTH